MYEHMSFLGDDSDFSIVSAFAPKGVFCMMTAARYYGLTAFLPDAMDIAIERSMRISTLPSVVLSSCVVKALLIISHFLLL